MSADTVVLLVCPRCRGELDITIEHLNCPRCDVRYPVNDSIPILVAESGDDELKRRQALFFDSEASDEFEISRPHGAPTLYGWLLGEKFRRSVSALGTTLYGATALCVCAGSGMDAEFLARRGARVIAVDISPGAARRTRERASRYGFEIRPIVADVEQLPFADASIDVVYVHDGLHHLEQPLTGLAEMARVARCAVCVTEPAQASVTRAAVRAGFALEREEAGNRVARLASADVVRMLAKDGFRVVHAERYGMFYRHEPGWPSRVLSSPGLFQLAKLGFRAANAVFSRFGNKLVVVAVRP
jgi:SAM-dependent methyltransferase